MKRDIEESLLAWKSQVKQKPLVVRGARQVGKSFSITKFGTTHFQNIHIINLEQRPDWHRVFEINFDVKRIKLELEILLGQVIDVEKDLLFFDEIQACPKAIMALRYFYEQIPQLHIIAAGSLLEFALNEISYPVGRISELEMYPMTFSEFLRANGKDMLADYMKSNQLINSEIIHQEILDQLQIYYLVGGMPECVQTFVDNKNMQQVQTIQDDLLNSYRQDFSKYQPQVDHRALNDILIAATDHITEQITYTKLSQNFTGPTNKKALDLLVTARILNKIYVTKPIGLPLKAHLNRKKFKIIFLDIGLLSRLKGNQPNMVKDYSNLFRGMMAEQFVGQELVAAVSRDMVFYWARDAKNSSAEVDYLVQTDGHIIPIEVKSGRGGALKSMHMLLSEFDQIEEGIVASLGQPNTLVEQKLKFVPMYMIGSVLR